MRTIGVETVGVDDAQAAGTVSLEAVREESSEVEAGTEEQLDAPADLVREIRRLMRLRAWMVIGSLCLLPVCFYMMIAALVLLFSPVRSAGIGVLAGCACVLGTALLLPCVGLRKRERLARLAARNKNTRAVGPLLLMLKANTLFTRREIETALCDLLPHLEPETPLSTDERDAFAFLLRFSSDKRLLRVALETVDRIPDLSPLVLFSVRSLEMQRGCLGDPEIQRMVRTLLPKLEALAHAKASPSVLLRASMPNTAPEETLLRAIDTTPSQTDPMELLRSPEQPPEKEF